MMARRWETRGWLLVMGLLALPAVARPKITAAVVALEPELEAQSLADWRALDAFSATNPRVTYVTTDKAAALDQATRTKKAAEARALYAEALAAFDDANMPAALMKANEALRRFEASDLSQGFQGYVECLALKALILQVTGASSASNELRRLFTLAPGYGFDSPRYNPGFMALAEHVRAKVQAKARVPLALRPPGPSALAYVDGTFRGVTPLVVPELPAGEHVVTLVSPLGGFFQAMATAGRGKSFEAALPVSDEGKALAQHLEQLRAGIRNDSYTKPAQALARWAGAEETLVIALARAGGRVEATLLRVLPDGRRLIGHHTGAPAATKERIEAMLALLDRQPPSLSPSVLEPAQEPPAVSLQRQVYDPSAWRQPRTWGFVSLGVGVAAATGGILFGLSAQQQALDARNVPQTDDTAYAQARASAEQTATVANGLYGVAAIGTGVGAWLLLTNRWPWSGNPAGRTPTAIRMSAVPLQQGGAILMEGNFH